MTENNIVEFHKFLENLPKGSYSSEVSFMSNKLPSFISLLGYERSQLFFEVGLPTLAGKYNFKADAVVTSERTRHPWILIETKRMKGHRTEISNWKIQLQEYKIQFKAEYGVLLSPYLLFFIHNQMTFEYQLDMIEIDQAAEIYSHLHGPLKISKQPTEILAQVSEKIEYSSISEINMETFRLQLNDYSHQLNFVRKAKTNDEKKRSFEGLAKLLFNGIPFLNCRETNLRTSSSEIDIVVEYRGWIRPTAFDEFGRFFLVECKNWKSAVGASQVRDFKGKLEKTKLKLGILFALKGITGANNGNDALREIRTMFDSCGIYVIIVAEEDLLAIQQRTNFYEMLDEKIFSLRFDI